MRVRLTVEVGDSTRRFIAKQIARAPGSCTKDGRARRRAIEIWIQGQLATAESEHLELFRAERDSRLTPLEEEEAALAVQHLRAAGKTDKQIVQWLILQRARLKFPVVREL